MTSSQSNSRSNGSVEHLVGVSKKLMDKSGKEGKLWDTDLLEYRVTLISSTTTPGLEIMLSTNPRTKLPQLSSNKLAKPLTMYKIYQYIKCQGRQGQGQKLTYSKLELGQPVYTRSRITRIFKCGNFDSR